MKIELRGKSGHLLPSSEDCSMVAGNTRHQLYGCRGASRDAMTRKSHGILRD